MPCPRSGLLPTFASSVAAPNPRSESRKPARYDAAIRAAHAALPQGPSLQSGLFCPGPSTLSRPHPPHSQARRAFPAVPVMCDAFAVRERLGDPRVVPCFRCPLFPDMPSSMPPECSSAACSQMHSSPTTMAFAHVSEARRTRHSRHPLRAGILFRGLLVRLRLFTFAAACPFARPPGGSDRDTGVPAHQPTRTFPSALSSGRSPFPTADMATVLPGKATPGGLSPARTSASIAARYVEYPPSSLVAAGTPRDATARSKFQSVVVLTRNLRYRKAGLLTDALIAGHRPVRAETCSRRVASAHSQFSRQVGSRVSGAGRGSKGTREMGALKG